MGNLHKWFSGSKSKDGKSGWVNVKTGGTCASDEPGEGTPKCVSSPKRDSMTKSERESASRRKKAADPGQQQKSGAAKPTYVSTDKPKKMKKEQFSNWRDNTPEPMVNELFGLGKKKENKNRGAGGSWGTSTSEARARSRGWKDPNEKPKPMSPFGPEKGTSKSPDKFENVKKTLGIRPKTEPKATSQTKTETKATSQTKTEPTPKSNPYSGKDKLKPQSFSTAVRSGTKMNKSTPSAPGKIVTQQGNQKEQFSNWRDNYVATEHEFIDLIKPEPMVGIGEGYKKLPKRKMGMKAGNKIISAAGHAGKAGAEEEGTIENQIRMQKAGKKAKQADKIHKTAGKHNENLSKLKSMKNKLVGMTKEELEISEEDKKGSGSGKKDACYKKVKASASVWPSAYASGRLVQCRKKGADNYGNSTKNEEWNPDPTENRQKKAAKLGREEDIEQIDEISKELATKAYAERRTNEVEGDQLHTKSNKTRNRIVKKYGEKAGKDADKAVDKKLYGNSTKNEEWKPDPTEKRQKKAAKLGREEDIEKGKSKKYGRDEDKIKDLYKRRMAVDFKKKKSSIGEERLEELKCWKGYKRKKGSTPGAPGSCVKEEKKQMPVNKMVRQAMGKVEKYQEIQSKADSLRKRAKKDDRKAEKGTRPDAAMKRLDADDRHSSSTQKEREVGKLKNQAIKVLTTAKKGTKSERFSDWRDDLSLMEGVSAWQRKEGQNPEGGLNKKGRESAKADGHDLKAPQPEGGDRKDSFCARMGGMKKKLTSAKTANDPDSRINKALRKWKCNN